MAKAYKEEENVDEGLDLADAALSRAHISIDKQVDRVEDLVKMGDTYELDNLDLVEITLYCVHYGSNESSRIGDQKWADKIGHHGVLGLEDLQDGVDSVQIDEEGDQP